MSINRGGEKKDIVHIPNGLLTIKRNEIMEFAATWMDVEIITLSEVRQWHTNVICYHLHVESKKGYNEFLCRTDTDSQMLKNRWFSKETSFRGEGWAGDLGWKCCQIRLWWSLHNSKHKIHWVKKKFDIVSMWMWVHILTLLSVLRVQCCWKLHLGHRCGSDLALLQLWWRLAGAALIPPLAQEYAMGVVLKQQTNK